MGSWLWCEFVKASVAPQEAGRTFRLLVISTVFRERRIELMTATDDEIAHLKAEIAELKAKHTPHPPAPEKPARPPAWAPQTDGTNVGMNFQGEPSPPSGGQNWIRARRPDGSWFDPNINQWRYSSGGLIPATIEPRPLAADDQRLRGNVKLLDQLIERDEELSRR
jgi:hypothetical protein